MVTLTESTTIKSRLLALLKTVLEDSRVNRAYHPVIMNLVNGFLAKTGDAEIREGILKMRDEIIPWILNEQVPAETDETDYHHKWPNASEIEAEEMKWPDPEPCDICDENQNLEQ